MAIVYSLHFKRSAEQYVRKAKEYDSSKQYDLALEEWKKALNEGYYLAFAYIGTYYSCNLVNVPGYSESDRCQECISLYEKMLKYDLREYDYKRAMASIGSAYEKLRYNEYAVNYYHKAEEYGYYSLHLFYYMNDDDENCEKYRELYRNNKCAGDPGGIYFDL